MSDSAAESRADRQYQNDLAAREEQRAYDRDALVRLVTDSEKAGFNPLTVLRNGGTSQFSSGAPLLSRQEPESSMGSAVSKVGDFLANFDPFADDKREQESRLIESQISALNAGGLSGVKRGRGSFASGDFDRSAPRKVAALSGASRSVAGKNAPGEGTIVGGDDPKASSMGWNNGKYGLFHAPWMPDAETWENIYGDNELGSMAYGIAKLNADAGYTIYRNAKSAYLSHVDKIKNTKPDAKYRKQYFDNIRDTVPSLVK